MPRSAWASAGASLIPSPTIATTPPARLQFIHDGRLALGQDPAARPPGGNPDCLGDGGNRRRLVARDEPDLDPGLGQPGDGLAGLRPDRVADPQDPADRAVDRDEDERPAGAVAPGIGLARGPDRSASSIPSSASSRRDPTSSRCPSTVRPDAMAGASPRSPRPAGIPARRGAPRATIAAPIGCSLPRSADAARSSSSAASRPSGADDAR